VYVRAVYGVFSADLASQIWVISVLVPYDDPRLLSGGGDARASPFVIAIDNAGIKGLPHDVNAVLLVAAWSAGNSDLVSTQRR
jgi:amino acid transporter